MGHVYKQLSCDERLMIFHWRGVGMSLREIARRLGRSASTISRELARNGRRTRKWPGGYCPNRAQRFARIRRARDARFVLARQPVLQALVRTRLAMGWSPAQISGRLAQDPYGPQISHESIYRYIWHRRELKDWLHRLLPTGRSRRRPWRKKKRGITGRRPIAERPEAVALRQQPGHWEIDSMRFATPRGGVLIACERVSRKLIARAIPSLTASATRLALVQMLGSLPDSTRRSLTFDNGAEFSAHASTGASLGAECWFCDPHAPWQKGSVENAIGRLRRHLPRKTPITNRNQDDIDRIIGKYNETPRHCLGYRTPNEVFNETVALQV